MTRLNSSAESFREAANKAHKQRIDVLPILYKSLTNDDAREANLKQRVVEYDTEIQQLDNTWMVGSNTATTTAEQDEIKAIQDQVATLKANRSTAVVEEYNSFRITRSTAASFRETAALRATSAAAAAALEVPNNGNGNPNNNAFTPLVYNASAVRENYFSSYLNKATNQLMKNINQPGVVQKAEDLWSGVSGSKGMIVTSEQVLKAWGSSPSEPDPKGAKAAKQNWGFQFQYNPGTVSMTYFTSPNVDVTMMTSGTEMFNLAGVSSSQGSIGFQIVINRMFDMQYYTEAGFLAPGAEVNYPKPPSKDEELALYNKGTMYDVEYLLRVLMSTTMSSYLRGEKTADMGWLPAIPVELHLGKSLRYLGIVNNLSLNHIIFNERMVPLFTTVDIGFARLPDYPPNDASSAGKAA